MSSVLLAVALLVMATRDADAVTPDGVLIIHSNQRVTPAAVVIEDTLRKRRAGGAATSRQALFRVSRRRMGVDRGVRSGAGGIPATEVRRTQRSRHRRVRSPRFSSRPSSAIGYSRVCPVVHIAMAKDRLDALALPTDVVGRSENHDPTPTLQLALRLHPNADAPRHRARGRRTGSALGRRACALPWDSVGNALEGRISLRASDRGSAATGGSLPARHHGIHARLFHRRRR